MDVRAQGVATSYLCPGCQASEEAAFEVVSAGPGDHAAGCVEAGDQRRVAWHTVTAGAGLHDSRV
ncbi:hypothetical protein [Kitasatospora sp. LaBMicrA B282]|uniref:hypothetical protein n=1 Tax=Kitasatospora sp. LaBMicrA B282 TaxID=3420949 RepID=UPI003D09F5DE